MKIAVDTRLLSSAYPERQGYFQYQVLKRIIANHPEHAFLFLSDHPHDKELIAGANITPVIAGPVAAHPLLWKWWYDVRVPGLLKKHQADVFVACNGICSLRTRVPQCLVLQDLAFLHSPSVKRSHVFFYRQYLPVFLHRAGAVAAVSGSLKKEIAAAYKIDAGKTTVVHTAADAVFCPPEESEKERIKEKYTDGKNYFLCTGAIHSHKNTINLLKAFSVFKKRQQSNWKLVLTGTMGRANRRFAESLGTYKYRDDIVLTGYVEQAELAKITGSAYALVCPAPCEDPVTTVLEAMRSAVPVIASGSPAMQEIAGDAALYADPGDPHDIAERMMRLYKDESLRIELAGKGRQRAQAYSWDRTAGLLWQSILDSVSA